ncbi:MAG: DUF488 family protein [Hoeflea sp.]|nr:DUF488 family protein [Hoeflea sp.]
MPPRPPVPDDPVARIRIKRIYRAARVSDGKRILVDRLWPRGVSKDRARLEAWARDVAPSDELRHWFHDNPDRFDEFRERYVRELATKGDLVDELAASAQDAVVTLLYASKDEEKNNAAVLQECLRHRLAQRVNTSVIRSIQRPFSSRCWRA